MAFRDTWLKPGVNKTTSRPHIASLLLSRALRTSCATSQAQITWL